MGLCLRPLCVLVMVSGLVQAGYQLLRRQVITVFYVEKLLSFVIAFKEVQRTKVLHTGSLKICIAHLGMQDAFSVAMLLIFVRLFHRKFWLHGRSFTISRRTHCYYAGVLKISQWWDERLFEAAVDCTDLRWIENFVLLHARPLLYRKRWWFIIFRPVLLIAKLDRFLFFRCLYLELLDFRGQLSSWLFMVTADTASHHIAQESY